MVASRGTQPPQRRCVRPPGQDGLEDVPGQDVLPGPPDAGGEPVAVGSRHVAGVSGLRPRHGIRSKQSGGLDPSRQLLDCCHAPVQPGLPWDVGDQEQPLSPEAESPRSPNAQASAQVSFEAGQRDALFREFLEYQKREAEKAGANPSQNEALFAEFQTYVKHLLQQPARPLNGREWQ